MSIIDESLFLFKIALILNNKTFDKVITQRVLINLATFKNQLVALKEVHRVLKKGGIGIFQIPIDVERRINGGAAVGAHRTSMLQDLDQGRPMEIDALVTSVQELGRITKTPTPTIDIVLSLIKLRARSANL